MRQSNPQNALLWYRSPASQWEEALPLGSGSLGMMVFGGMETEILQLNEETLWSGRLHQWDNPQCLEHLPEMRELLFQRRYGQAQELCRKYLVCSGKGSDSEDYGSYQTAGELHISSNIPETSGYTRTLDLRKGVAETRFGTVHRRHTVSHQYQVTASHLTGCSEYALSFHRENAQVSYHGCEILVLGRNSALTFCTLVQIETDGKTAVEADALRLRDCGYLTIWTCTATSYSGEDPEQVCRTRIAAGRNVGFEAVLSSQQNWMEEAMGRCHLALPVDSAAAALPTDARLARVRNGQMDADLLRLYFDYGRYLLICSAWGQLPANLQGIWSKDLFTPWNGDYHTNINLQMNYWFVDAVGLEEYGGALYRYLAFLAQHGQTTAKAMYGCRGWVAHTLTNPWGFTAPGQDPAWGSFHAAGAWCCRHLYEHYLYTGDLEFLKAYWPVIHDCALFFRDFLAEDPKTGYRDIYFRYRDYRFDPIEKTTTFDTSVFSASEKAICDSVINNICCYSGKILERFTHNEAPWLTTRGDLPDSAPSDRIIEKSVIGAYFDAVKAKYNMVNPRDIKDYAQDMFQQL